MKDSDYLRLCLKLATKGEGKVAPNPMVGAVIVKDELIIGSGWHNKFGGYHAEVNAINGTEQDLSGATLYCNLEPCSHTDKKTPPCVPMIIKNNISKVVICTLDPNPKVNGKGVEQLRNAGIIVEIGILANEAKEFNKEYFKQFI